MDVSLYIFGGTAWISKIGNTKKLVMQPTCPGSKNTDLLISVNSFLISQFWKHVPIVLNSQDIYRRRQSS